MVKLPSNGLPSGSVKKIFESFNISVDDNMCHVDIQFPMVVIPRNESDVFMWWVNNYLSNKGIPDNLEQIIDKLYPEYLI